MCNPLYTVYFTAPKKDRLSIVKGSQNGQELEFILNPLTYELLENFQLAIKWKNTLKLLPQETVFSCTQFDALLDTYLPKLGSVQRNRVLETAAMPSAVNYAFYHQQTDWPVVHTLVCDHARANASKLLLITTKVKNQRKNQYFAFDLFSKLQSDRSTYVNK